MPKTYNPKPEKGLGEVTTAKNGEMIIFALQFGMPESDAAAAEHFAIPHDSLANFIAGLVDIGNKAVALRAKHRAPGGSEDLESYAYKLENGAIGPSSIPRGGRSTAVPASLQRSCVVLTFRHCGSLRRIPISCTMQTGMALLLMSPAFQMASIRWSLASSFIRLPAL